jgi:hypothetical protein
MSIRWLFRLRAGTGLIGGGKLADLRQIQGQGGRPGGPLAAGLAVGPPIDADQFFVAAYTIRPPTSVIRVLIPLI